MRKTTASLITLALLVAGPITAAQATTHKPAKAKRGPRGPRGPQGPAGPQGPQGPAGPVPITSVQYLAGTPVTMCPATGGACAVASAEAVCPAGTTLVGGGFFSSVPYTYVSYSAPKGGNAWGVIAINNGTIEGTITAVATCLSGSVRPQR